MAENLTLTLCTMLYDTFQRTGGLCVRMPYICVFHCLGASSASVLQGLLEEKPFLSLSFLLGVRHSKPCIALTKSILFYSAYLWSQFFGGCRVYLSIVWIVIAEWKNFCTKVLSFVLELFPILLLMEQEDTLQLHRVAKKKSFPLAGKRQHQETASW